VQLRLALLESSYEGLVLVATPKLLLGISTASATSWRFAPVVSRSIASCFLSVRAPAGAMFRSCGNARCSWCPSLASLISSLQLFRPFKLPLVRLSDAWQADLETKSRRRELSDLSRDRPPEDRRLVPSSDPVRRHSVSHRDGCDGFSPRTRRKRLRLSATQCEARVNILVRRDGARAVPTPLPQGSARRSPKSTPPLGLSVSSPWEVSTVILALIAVEAVWQLRIVVGILRELITG
jgi:hypothetical protein